MRGKALERAVKTMAYAALRVAIGNPAKALGDCPLAPLRRVLVVRQDRRLGNLVLLTPLLAGLRRGAPDARIAVVAPKAFAPVLSPHPAVDQVLAIDHERLLRHPLEIARLERRLKAFDAELAIDATPHHSASFLNGLLTYGSGAPFRLGYDRGEARTFLNLLVPPPSAPAHESVLLHDLLLAIAPDLGPPSPPRIQVPLRSLAIAHRACVRHGLDEERRVVGIHPGGRRGKRWDSARFDQVAAELERRGIVVVVLTGPAERPLLAGMGPPGPQRIYAPPLDLEGLRGFLAGLDAFLSGDSGPMHLAAALGVPCVSVFRVPDYPRYAPLGPEHRVLFDPRGDLAPGAVAAAVIEVLQAGTAPRRQGTALRRQGTGPRRQLSRMTAAPHR